MGAGGGAGGPSPVARSILRPPAERSFIAPAQLPAIEMRPPPRQEPQGWEAWLKHLEDPNSPRYVIVDAKNGLGNRLRALCSSMSVAASLHRRVLLLWQADLHCNCSLRTLVKGPLPFALVERPPRGAVPGRSPNAQT